ncbi:hypothetical protein OMW55_08330 [Sphingomonas sp. BN140010]|uniref:Uncharacterized protein n=1 Tax=Sphingomonas arvum TaxID=2992113 RepID=A0ABT3JFF3_9SPHN|nr:hypothetical protein [Sphingomonas sp. BN140010]MCW3797808.1 hypothetical protein [Sphingomonas sp. BN140010]
MDAFSYLSVLLSIILGLAIQQVLQGYRALILSRRTIRFYPLPLIWSVLILLMVTQHWWASFSLARRTDWSFAAFATTLVLTGFIYMLAAIVLPDVRADEPLDLKGIITARRRRSSASRWRCCCGACSANICWKAGCPSGRT